MANSKRVENFSADKASFFSSSAQKTLIQIREEVRHKYAVKVGPLSPVLDPIQASQNGLDYSFQFLAENRLLIEQEFETLSASLKQTENRLLIEQEFETLPASLKQTVDHGDAIRKYAYYCCFMLESYYSEDAYSVPSQVKKYHAERKALENKINKTVPPKVSLASTGEKISDGIHYAINSINHTSDLRSWLTFFNMNRLLFVFSRLSVRQSLVLAQELHWLDSLSRLIGRQIDADAMIRMINAPAGIFNALSVQIFALRFLLIVGEGLKHVLAPTEKERSLSRLDRFKQEVFDRHCDILNDVTWGVVNLLSNFRGMFNLSANVANGLTAGFLFFDVSLLLYRRFLSKQDYEIKKGQLTKELDDVSKNLTFVNYDQHILMLNEQIRQLNSDWDVTSAHLLFNAAAATLLMAGYSAAILLTGPAAVAASFVVCSFAVAMYLSAGEYKAYKEKSMLLLAQERKDAPDLLANKAVMAEKQEAFYHLINTLVKNTVLPMLIVTLFAVNWPAALLVTTLYVAHECLVSNKPKKTPDWQLSDAQKEATEDALLLSAP